MEKTLILLKPDTIQRGLIGRIIARFEDKGMTICGIKMMNLSKKLLDEHYAHVSDKPFYPGVVKFMQSTPVIVLCVKAQDAIAQVRKILGATNCRQAENGTIRSDFGNSIACNLVHASDSAQTAKAEIKRFFKDGETFDYDLLLDQFVYEK